jgi:hypothetical protein
MELNKEGFVIKTTSGVETFSNYSALSGVPLNNGAITMPVSGVPGLYVRLASGEGRLTAEQQADIERRATAWFQARQPAPKAPTAPRRSAAVSTEKQDEKED